MPEWILEAVYAFWSNLSQMAPYLLFGFLVAGALSVLIRPETVERQLGGRGLWSAVKASAFGVPLPLCSCGVIPVAASLRKHGASRGATTAFLLSTPQTGVDSIMVTLSLLGPVFAIYRPLAALATGILGGGLVALLERERGARMAPDACTDACCTGEGPKNRLARALSYGFVTLPRDIGKSLLVGLALAGVIAVVVPKDLATAYGTGFVGMLALMALGIPIYVCATASVPIAAALIVKGVSPGAALAFLITGPATNAATIAVIWRTMGRRTATIYLASVVVASLGCGALLDVIYTHTGAATANQVHQMLPQWLKLASAIVLLGVLGFALLSRQKEDEHEPMADEAPETIELDVKGMTCSHCVEAVTRALRECPGVASAQVGLKSGRAVVRGKGLDAETLRQAVEALGYTARQSSPETAE